MPAGKVAADSYELVCASCQHPLRISELSRNFAAFAGLVAGAIAWWIVTLRFESRPGAAGLGVAGVPGLSGDERRGSVDVNVGGQFGIKDRRSDAAKSAMLRLQYLININEL